MYGDFITVTYSVSNLFTSASFNCQSCHPHASIHRGKLDLINFSFFGSCHVSTSDVTDAKNIWFPIPLSARGLYLHLVCNGIVLGVNICGVIVLN